MTTIKELRSIDTQRTFASDGLYFFGVKKGIDPYFITSVLNSKLFVFIYRPLSLEKGRTLAQVKPTLLNDLPIITQDKNLQNMISLKAKLMLEKKDQFRNTKTPQELTILQLKIEATDKQIDQFVYQLYGLTEEEIKIVEEATSYFLILLNSLFLERSWTFKLPILMKEDGLCKFSLHTKLKFFKSPSPYYRLCENYIFKGSRNLWVAILT